MQISEIKNTDDEFWIHDNAMDCFIMVLGVRGLKENGDVELLVQWCNKGQGAGCFFQGDVQVINVKKEYIPRWKKFYPNKWREVS